jgi:RNA polymerase sigma factor (sigma-70 family)
VNELTPLVFVVDDDVAILRSLRRLLVSLGHVVETFSSPVEFLDRAAPEGPACAIIDLSMPQMNGLEVQEEISRRKWPCSVIVLTGHGDIPDSVRALKSGAVDFLTKPVDDEMLANAIAVALRQQEQMLELRVQNEQLKNRFATLTEREQQVMKLVVAGYINKQIAYELGISEKTVKAHRAKVMQKTGTRSLAALVHLNIELCRSDGGVPDAPD